MGLSAQGNPSPPLILRDRYYSSKTGQRQRLYQMLERPGSSRLGMAILVTLILCIFSSIAVYFASSLEHDISPTLQAVETFCTVVFAQIVPRY